MLASGRPVMVAPNPPEEEREQKVSHIRKMWFTSGILKDMFACEMASILLDREWR
jgi:hypothetical protein